MRGGGRPAPAGATPLRFGTYRVRYLVAIGLLFAGGALLQFSSAYTLALTAIGLAASIAGWIVVPAPGGRRAAVLAPALLGVFALLGGAQSGGMLVLTLAAWLIVRMRPLVSFVVLVFPAAASYGLAQLFPHYGAGVVVAIAMTAVLVASAWAARLIATTTFAQRRITLRRN